MQDCGLEKTGLGQKGYLNGTGVHSQLKGLPLLPTVYIGRLIFLLVSQLEKSRPRMKNFRPI